MAFSTPSTSVTYTGTGGGGSFPVPFAFVSRSHVVVEVRALPGGPATLLAEGTDYALSGERNPTGGTLTLLPAYGPLAAGAQLTVRRVVPLTQSTQLPYYGPLSAAVLEDALDVAAMRSQAEADARAALEGRTMALESAGAGVSALEPRVASLEAADTALGTRTSALESVATVLAATDSAHTAQLNAVAVSLTTAVGVPPSEKNWPVTLKQQVDNLGTRATALESADTTLGTRATALEGRATTTESNVSTLGTRVTTVEGRAFTLEGRATALESADTALGTRVTTVEGTTSTLGTRATALEGRATALEAADGTLGTRTTTLEGRAFTIEGNVTALTGRVTTLESAGGGGGSSQWVNGAAGAISYSAGNVGFGLTGPSERVDVSGNVKASGSGTFGGTLGVTGTSTLGTVNATAVTASTSVNTPSVRDAGNNARIGLTAGGGTTYTGTNPAATAATVHLFNHSVAQTNASTKLLVVSSDTGATEKFSVSQAGNATVAGGMTVDTNALVVDAANNRVGCNRSVPTETLDVNGNATISGTLSAGNSTLNSITTTGGVTVGSGMTVDGATFCVDSADNEVGFGTTAPAFQVHVVNNTTGNQPSVVFDKSANAVAGATLTLRSSRGTAASPTASQANDELGTLAFRGRAATSYSTDRASLSVVAPQTWTDTSQPTEIRLLTTPIGSNTPAARLTISNDGTTTLTQATVTGAITSGQDTFSDVWSTVGQTVGGSEMYIDFDTTRATTQAWVVGGTGNYYFQAPSAGRYSVKVFVRVNGYTAGADASTFLWVQVLNSSGAPLYRHYVAGMDSAPSSTAIYLRGATVMILGASERIKIGLVKPSAGSGTIATGPEDTWCTITKERG